MNIDASNSRMCPQCDGSGQEELGATPMVCRKCGGGGSVAGMARTASFMYGGETLEKTAQGDLDDDFGDEDDDDDDFGMEGSGIDELSASVGGMSADDLKHSIMQFIKAMDTSSINKLFERVFSVLGTNYETSRMEVVDPRTGEFDDLKAINYIALAIDAMDLMKLKAMYCEARRLM